MEIARIHLSDRCIKIKAQFYFLKTIELLLKRMDMQSNTSDMFIESFQLVMIYCLSSNYIVDKSREEELDA